MLINLDWPNTRPTMTTELKAGNFMMSVFDPDKLGGIGDETIYIRVGQFRT